MSADQETEAVPTTTITLPSDALEDHLEAVPDAALTEEIEARAREYCEILDGHQFASGRSSTCLAASALYGAHLAKGQTIRYDRKRSDSFQLLSQRQIAEFCNVSKATIGKQYREIIRIWGAETDTEVHL